MMEWSELKRFLENLKTRVANDTATITKDAIENGISQRLVETLYDRLLHPEKATGKLGLAWLGISQGSIYQKENIVFWEVYLSYAWINEIHPTYGKYYIQDTLNDLDPFINSITEKVFAKMESEY